MPWTTTCAAWRTTTPCCARWPRAWRRSAAAIRRCRRLSVASAHTNILFTDVHSDIAPALMAWLSQHGIYVTRSLCGGQIRLRWVTHLDVGPEDVEHTLGCVEEFQG